MIGIPSTVTRLSLARLPWTTRFMPVSGIEPPTFCRTPVTSTDGVNAAKLTKLRSVGSTSIDFARRGRQLRRALRVDDGRLAGHRDRLFDGPHSQVGVDVRRETGRELNPFALDGAESGKRERHTVGAGTQIDDRVSPLTVCHDGSSFLDEGRARCLDRHTGQDRARRIAHDAGNRAGLSLGVGPRRNEHQHCERKEAKGSCTSIPHESPPVDCFD